MSKTTGERPSGPRASEAPPPSPPSAPPDLTAVVGENLKRLRTKRGLSLERLAKVCGVSKAMLGQIELGQSTPTVNTVWKIAVALGVPFAALIEQGAPAPYVVLRARESKVLLSSDGLFRSRALFPYDERHSTELYELRFAPGAEERADAHAPGTRENLAVHEGQLAVSFGNVKNVLGAGDSLVFDADLPHVYRNVGSVEVIAFLVMTYAS